ncbi:uncharacterized protein LOC124358976 isoform X2 [Homalodisca vitripennis]|uniref:uncharacterized protein LOC124358976 isoform X2 n=1 Tax=Homalodisca vitripennis TaxID=197043 RepID=UPI001EEB639C|nr:uncharacterized protein LOC124358976 isoform X2 [Homalodisca vitripennis]
MVSVALKERGLSEVCLQGMETEHTIVASSSAPTTVTTVAPFHYLINEQAKSIAALQELQNEVTALLEFRDLVMETFPHLRTKTEPSTPIARHGTASLQNSKRDWEPGIRVRRKLREQETSLVPRSRSNSHGKAGRSEAGNSGSSTGSSAVQDSGFCTESKEHCSTSTTTTTTVRKTDQDQEAEDELWTLLELIHRKGTKLRLEVEHLQEKFDKKDDVQERRSKSLEDLRRGREPPRTRCDGVYEVEVEGLRRERDMLLDRVTEMEAENLANLAQTNQLLAEMGALTAEKRDLEDQLRAAIHTKTELNSRIHDLHSQFVSRSDNKLSKALISPLAVHSKGIQKLGSSQFVGTGSHFTPVKRSLSNEETVSSADDSPGIKEFQRLKQREEHPNRLKRTSKELTVLKSADYSDSEDGLKIDDSPKFSTPKSDKVFMLSPRFSCSGSSNPVSERLNASDSKCVHVHGKLGTLDGVVSSPSNKIKGAKGVLPDKDKTAAILKEKNVVELQRHLLTTSFENQVARHKMQQLSTSCKDLSLQLDRVREDNEDLRFQLEEKSIELEGTRARVRLLERLQAAKLSGELTHSHTLPPPSHESPPAPLLPRLALPPPLPATDHSSSTESAHHDDINSPRRRPPSKIPLKSYTAPKPPSGKPVAAVRTTTKIKDTTPSWGKKEKNWDPVTRSMKDISAGKRESPRPASRESVNTSSNINRRVRKTSNQDGSFSSTNSTPSIRRDPPSSPAPKKIPQRDRIISSDSESKARPVSEYPDSLNTDEPRASEVSSQELDRSLPSRVWRHSGSDTEYFDSIDNHSSCYQSAGEREALADCDSLETELGDLV